MNIPDEGIIESHLSDTHYDENDGWSNYVKGMIFYLQKKGFQIESGLDILFFGNIPYGAGLSSSASLEMVSGVLLQDIFKLEISMLELVKIAQKVENKYIGVNNGIIDKFSVCIVTETNNNIMIIILIYLFYSICIYTFNIILKIINNN